MLRQNTPMYFGELNMATETVDKEFLDDMTKIIFKFYTENMDNEEIFDPTDYKTAKKCLKTIFKSIQKVPKEKKTKKLPNKKKPNIFD